MTQTETSRTPDWLSQLVLSGIRCTRSIPGSTRLLSQLFPCCPDASRYIAGMQLRSDGLLMQLDSRNWIERNVLFTEYEPHLCRLFSTLLTPGATAVDVGANIGVHTLTLASCVTEKGKVLAIEPNPATFERLLHNVAINGFSQVLTYNVGIGEREGRLPLKVPAPGSDEYSNMGLASFVALETPHITVNVPVTSLDRLIEDSKPLSVDLIKLDIQGYEYAALCGMQETLHDYSPAIVFEYEAWAWEKAGRTLKDATSMLADFSYTLYKIDPQRGVRLMSQRFQDLLISDCHSEFLAIKHNDSRVALLD